jgi:hypothetical protein
MLFRIVLIEHFCLELSSAHLTFQECDNHYFVPSLGYLRYCNGRISISHRCSAAPSCDNSLS